MFDLTSHQNLIETKYQKVEYESHYSLGEKVEEASILTDHFIEKQSKINQEISSAHTDIGNFFKRFYLPTLTM
jgi:hypothetical protein